MDKRQQDILDLETYIERADNDLCLILQSLQWDKSKTLQGGETAVCDNDQNHRVPIYKLYEHHKKCVLKAQGYAEDDMLLPAVAYPSSRNCVEFDNKYIEEIISRASEFDQRKKIRDPRPPMTLSRIQTAYTQKERGAIYEAVIARAPPPQVTEDDGLTLSCTFEQSDKPKSRLELLAEQRDMKRRRTKYRVTTKHKNYSEVLREVIQNQMELYLESQQHLESKKGSSSIETEDVNAEHEESTSNSSKSKHGSPYKDRDSRRSYEEHDSTRRDKSRSHRDGEAGHSHRRYNNEGRSDYRSRRYARSNYELGKDARERASHKRHGRH